jgi:hypothetical protein
MRTVAFGLLFSIFSFFDLYGQEEPQAVWVMPGKIGLKFYADGKVDTFKSSFDTLNISLSLQEPMASIYFPKLKDYLYINNVYLKGKILSRSDSTIISQVVSGGNIYDSHDSIILNGDSIHLQYSVTNGALFLPINDTSCYLFTIGPEKKYVGEARSIMDKINFQLKLYGYKIVYRKGRFEVVEKDRLLATEYVPESMTATRHANGKDWWLITREINNQSNGFLRFHIRPDSIIRYPNQYIGPYVCPEKYFGSFCLGGEIAFNRSGTHIVAGVESGTNVIVYEFDRCSGSISSRFKNLNLSSISGKSIFYSKAISNSGKSVFLGRSWDFGFYICNTEDPQNMYLYNHNPPFQQFENHPIEDKIIFPFATIERLSKGNSAFGIIHEPDSLGLDCKIDTNWIPIPINKRTVFSYGLPNTANHLLPAIPYDFSVDRKPKPYRDTLCIYDSTALGGWYPAGKHLHRWYPTSGLSNDTSGLVTFRPPVITKQDTVYTFYLHTEGRAGGCLEGQSRIDTFRVFVWGNGRGGCRTVSRLDAIPPQVFQIYPNPTNGTLYIKSSWEEMKKVLLYNMAGQVVFERQLSATEATLHIGDLADGTYLCKITTTEGIFTQKVVLIR